MLVSIFCAGLLLWSGCGQTYSLQSITMAPPSPNLSGIGASQQFTVTAHYSNGKTEDITTKVAFVLSPSALAPLSAETISASGIVQNVVGACTWTAVANPAPATGYTYGTDPYTLTATYSGFTAESFVSVASLADCWNPSNTHP